MTVFSHLFCHIWSALESTKLQLFLWIHLYWCFFFLWTNYGRHTAPSYVIRVWNLPSFVHFILCNSEEIWQSYSIFFLLLFSHCSKQMQTISLCAKWDCLYILTSHNTTKGWHVPRIIWTPVQVQMIFGARHHLVIIFSENKDFHVALPILLHMT